MNTVEEFSISYERLLHELINEETMTAIGLQMAGTDLFFETNENFELKEETFGYYSPDTNSIHINIEHSFFNRNDDIQETRLLFIIYHECMHRLLNHFSRMGSREPYIWNIAADYEVHNLLKTYCDLFNGNEKTMFQKRFKYLLDLLEWCDRANHHKCQSTSEFNKENLFCFKKEYLNLTAEEIYEKILDEAKITSNNLRNGATKTTYTLPNGSEVETVNFYRASSNDENDSKKQIIDDFDSEIKMTHCDSQQVNSSSNKQIDQELKRQMLRTNFNDIANRMKSDGTRQISELLKKLFDIKVDWTKILKASLQTVLTKDDTYSWASPRATMLAMDMYLPSIEETCSEYGTLLIARDESGSMSKEDLEKAASVISSAKDKYSKIILIKHSDRIASVKEYEDLDDRSLKEVYTAEAIGGTSHKEVFKFIKDYYMKNRNDDGKNALSCCIFFTDCCSDIEMHQNTIPQEIPLIYICPRGTKQNYGQNIRGMFIEI